MTCAGGGDGEARDRAWAVLTARYPGSIWALRVPSALEQASPLSDSGSAAGEHP
jgi:hypothetical protein